MAVILRIKVHVIGVLKTDMPMAKLGIDDTGDAEFFP